MTSIILPHQWQPRWYQAKLWNYLLRGGKRAMCIWHRRAGKDATFLNWTALAAHLRVGNYWHCLPEYAQAKKAIWKGVNSHTGRRIIDEAFPKELRASTNETEMLITFKNGSTWQLVGSDNYDGLVGAGVVGVTFSEWALCNPAAWAYIMPMLEENGGWAFFITTPRGRNHAKSMLEANRDNPDWFTQTLSISDTKALTSKQLIGILDQYVALYGEEAGTALFQQEYFCSFDAANIGSYYGSLIIKVRSEGRVKEFDAIPGYPVHTAWDFGASQKEDSNVIWWFQKVNGKIYVLDVEASPAVHIDKLSALVKEKPWQKGLDYVPHDEKQSTWGSGKTKAEIMTGAGLKPTPIPKVSKKDIISAVRVTLPNCIFHTRCETGLTALELWHRKWDTEKNIYLPHDVHDWTSHYADAFGYLALVADLRDESDIAEKSKPKPAKPLIDPAFLPPDLMPQRTGRIKI